MRPWEENPVEITLHKPEKPLPPSLRRLVGELQARRGWKPAELVRLLESAAVPAEDLAPWADYDHSPSDSYGRKMVYEGGHFEVMVMSWAPGDFAAIHDHGYTQWGAVKVFGPAEHATFRMRDRRLTTLRRWTMTPGDVIGVSHDLLHQMGNPTDEHHFLSLHVYGLEEDIDNVTGDARLMDLYRGKVQRINGGVFFALPAEAIEREEESISADFPTRFRHLVELVARLRRMRRAGLPTPGYRLQDVEEELFAAKQFHELLAYVRSLVDERGKATESRKWEQLKWELKAAARLLRAGESGTGDRFRHYAEVYDKLIGQPCLDDFTAAYLDLFRRQADLDLTRASLLSLGVGTGLTERYLIDHLGIPEEKVLGVDRSAAMVQVAHGRVPARRADLLDLPADLGTFDILYSGLNVLQYLPALSLEDALMQAARHLRAGGYFLGDFIAPDHIEKYPNLIVSADERVISLRSPRVETIQGRSFQLSNIVNVDVLEGRLNVHASGTHKRYLPGLDEVRALFRDHFGPEVRLYDAVSLELLPEGATTSASTRYVVIARKAE